MIGSTMIVDFESRDELDRYLETEPYVTGKVWENIDVTPCKIPPVFLKISTLGQSHFAVTLGRKSRCPDLVTS